MAEVRYMAPALFAGLVPALMFGASEGAEASVQTVDLGISAHQSTGHSDWNTPVSTDDRGNTYVVFNDEQLRVVSVKIDAENSISAGIVDTGVADDPGHNTPSMAVDGDGFIHVWYDMHNDKMKLKKSNAPRRVDAGWSHESGPWPGRYTYPAATVAPNGDVYLAVRRKLGWSCELFHYDLSEKNWRLVANFAQASGFVCYLPRPYAASNGKVHLSFQWRRGGPGGNRHLGSYAVYDPVEGTFRRADGSEYSLPISPLTADAFQPLETLWENRFGISAHGVTVNDQGQPLMVYNFFRAGNPDWRVVRLARWDGVAWVRSDIAGPAGDTTLGDADIVNRDGHISVFYNDVSGRLVWKQSVDDGSRFLFEKRLTEKKVSSPWVHVGSRTSTAEEPVLVCIDEGETACRILFVPRNPDSGSRTGSN